MQKTFKAIEHVSGFEVEHIATGKRAWMGDGVDTLFSPSGRAYSPGSARFLGMLENSLNESEMDTLEAYFPELCE